MLEKAPGKQLSEVWDDMDLRARFKLLANLAQLEAQLANIRFPCSGALYFRAFARSRKTASGGTYSRFHDLDVSLDSQGRYCIGPAFDEYWPGNFLPITAESEALAGPCMHTALYLPLCFTPSFDIRVCN